MRFLVPLVLVLAAGPAAAQGGRSAPSGCKEDYATCKEDCTIEYGGSGKKLKQLTRCMGECQGTLDMCADRHSSLRDLRPGVADEPGPARASGRPRPSSQEEDPFGDSAPAARRGGKEDPFAEERPAKPASNPESLGTTRQGVYRASEAEAEPAPAPSGLEDLEPLDAKPAAPAPVAAKPAPKAEPVRPAPAPVAASVEDEKDPLLDEAPPPAPVEKKKPAPVAAPSRPAPPPEPKKDISEWDPNGD